MKKERKEKRRSGTYADRKSLYAGRRSTLETVLEMAKKAGMSDEQIREKVDNYMAKKRI